jgi:hypothetical protein
MLPVRLELRDEPAVPEKCVGVLGVLEEMAWGPMDPTVRTAVMPWIQCRTLVQVEGTTPDDGQGARV